MHFRKLLQVFIFSPLFLFPILWITNAASADLVFQEQTLNPDGTAYEINADTDGLLWISDNGAGEIWVLEPATGVYTTFQGAGAPSDARRAPDGSVWWIDQDTGRLGHLLPETGDTTLWDIPVTTTPFGTATDGDGQIWMTEVFHPRIYRFALSSSQLCTYTFGTSGASDYILADGTDIWLGDWINDQIHHLDSSTGLLTSWALPSNAQPEGLAMDSTGHFWWADPDLGHLRRLEPNLDLLSTYNLPYGSSPEMVAASGNVIWYTEDTIGTLGRLDPGTATGSSQTMISETTTLVPTCASINPAAQGTLTVTTGTASWASAVYTLTVDADGWMIHELPVDAYPWGIAASGGGIWVVDNGRQVLIHVQEILTFRACKQVDADGYLGTTGDQAPRENWPMHLVLDGVIQAPSQLTGADGCTTWSDLEAGHTYGVEEDNPSGWTALTPISHTFGAIASGGVYTHTFVNAENVSVTACKLADNDGELATAEDQTPQIDWTMFLLVDSIRQEPGQNTGENGCTTWDDLAPGHTYGVEEANPSGWVPLTPVSYTFGTITPGHSQSHTFINYEETVYLYLPMVVRIKGG